MTTSANTTRRSALRTLFVLGVFGPLLPYELLMQQERSQALYPLPLKLAHFFLSKESAKVIGSEYLQCVPMEADVHLLTNLICSFQAKRRIELTRADASTFRELLLDQQCQDFTHDRIVEVHGWILSETEARLCALAALV